MTRRRSRKRSDTSSRLELPKLPPLYIDESLSQLFLPEALRARAVTVLVRADKFPAGVTDPEWLTEAGRQKWIVLTKDKAIKRRPNELMALLNSGVRAFVLAAGEMTGQEQAELFVRILPRIRSYVAELGVGPFIVRVTKTGTCELVRAHQSAGRPREPERRRRKSGRG